MSEVKTQEFRQASARVLANAKLQSFLSRSMGTFDGARAEAIEEISPQRWEELREQGREIKRHTLDNLDYYLELLQRTGALKMAVTCTSPRTPTRPAP